jgi:hypothetical protein
MTDTKKHTFIVSDETVVNSYGIRVLTAGIDIRQFKRNPIVLWMHKRPKPYREGKEDELLPIGRAVRVWKDEGRLYADVEFDQEDDFAKIVEGKVERHIINMCSPGITPVTVSDDSKHMLQGQTGPTIVKSELNEISIVDIGSNPNALALYDEDGIEIQLSAGGGAGLTAFLEKPQITNKMKNIAIKLGLDAEASEASILKALDEQLSLAAKTESVTQENDQLKKAAEQAEEARILTLVDDHVDRKFTADKKDHFVAMGKKLGYDNLKLTFDTMADIGEGKPTSVTGASDEKSKDGPVEMTFADLKAKGLQEIEKFKKEHPKKYIELYKAEYGVEPDMGYDR